MTCSLLSEFFEKCPASTVQLLVSEDKAYFLTIFAVPRPEACSVYSCAGCQLQSLVQEGMFPFISIFIFLLILISSQDSLWAAENIEAVFDQDPQCICILQGPITVKRTKV